MTFTKSLSFSIILLALSSLVLAQNGAGKIHQGDSQVIPDYSWLNQKDGPRPKYVWENREDCMYHDRYYSDSAKMTAPEIYPIMRSAWVFNRAMKWIRNQDGTIIVFSEGGDLMLTGEKQVSGWYSDPQNEITNAGDLTTFEKTNNKRRRDCAVLPSFQFHIGQHPVLEVTVLESTDDWQFVASLKGRSGAPFISSGWQSGAKTMQFDVSEALKNKGYDWNYPEVHFAIGTWAGNAESNSKIKFRMRLIAQPAVVGCLPVIRRVQSAGNGIPVSAIVTGRNNFSSLKIYASIEGKKYEMTKNGEVWSAMISGLAVGSYNLKFSSDIPEIAESSVLIRVTDGNFWKHNKQYNTLEKNGMTSSPLNGSFQGTFFFKDAGLSSEQLINSQNEWDQWNKAESPGEHMHFWESLTRTELNDRFSYLAKNGWDMLFLHSHYGIWERFDASGNLAPHGVEQFAAYVDEAARNNLQVMVALSSYPYEDSGNNTSFTEGTKPYIQTLEKGFKAEDWHNPENEPFRTYYHQYIKDFITTFRDESSIFAFSSSGEGDADAINGIKRFLDTREVIKSIDTDHVIVSEPIWVYNLTDRIPSSYVKGYTSDLVGCRNYLLGTRFRPEEEMSMYLRLSQSVPNLYIAEGSWPSSNIYTKFSVSKENNSTRNSWVGTEDYRRNVRDWIYTGFIYRMPLIMTWDETFTEDERIVLKEVKSLLNMNQKPETASVSIVVNDSNYNSVISDLGKFERLFSGLAINYRFIEKSSEANPGDWIIDPARPFDYAKYSNVQNLPSNVRKSRPFNLSENFAACFNFSDDGKSMLAYIINKSNYIEKQYNLSGRIQRLPVSSKFELSMLNIPENLNYRLYDLDSKKIILAGKTGKNSKLKVENTKADFLLVVYP